MSAILNEYVNKTNWDNMNIYEAIYNELQYLPKRFHREFLQEVVMSVKWQTVKTIGEIGSQYLCEVYDEFTEQEKQGNFFVSIGGN